jgi:hypothetical protein
MIYCEKCGCELEFDNPFKLCQGCKLAVDMIEQDAIGELEVI